MPDRVSSFTFMSAAGVCGPLSAIEKCELSFCGLQCTFASAAGRG